MEADGEDDAEEGVMAYRQVGRRRVATLAMGDQTAEFLFLIIKQRERGGGDERSGRGKREEDNLY